MSNYKDFPRSVRKRGFMRSLRKLRLPYPNFGLGETELPSLCRCYFDGEQFFVRHEKDMSILYQNGAFGRSSRTFRGPSGLLEFPFRSQVYYQKKLLQGGGKNDNLLTPTKDQNENLSCPPVDSMKNVSVDLDPKSEETGIESCVQIEQPEVKVNGIEMETREEVLDDVDGPAPSMSTSTFDRLRQSPEPEDSFSKKSKMEEYNPPIVDPVEEEPDQEEERLILLPEEVIFLSFAIGCISIQDSTTGDTLCFQNIWSTIVREREEFPFVYAVYHYFRSKNWVPKDGSAFGADFVLYELGPDFYHSAYVVHITGPVSRRTPNWRELFAWQRVASTVTKSILLCKVNVPSSLVCDETSTPNCIFKMNLQETVLHRWTHSLTGTEGWDWED